MELSTTTVKVPDISLSLVTYNRALELCARMNYETEVLDFIDSIPTGAVLFDLGACEGRFALYAAARGVVTYAFEPELRNFEALMQNAELNGMVGSSMFYPQNLAVGEAYRSATLKIGQEWAGGHQKVVETPGTRQDLNFNFVAEQMIQVVDLDSFIIKESSPFPNFLKVDVDGSEIAFLRGARNMLIDSRLKGIIFELCKTDPGYREILNDLERSGFQISSENRVPNNDDLYNITFQRRN